MLPHEKIYVAGHRGLVGSAIVRRLQAEGFTRIITKTHAELDLTSHEAVRLFFEREKPDYVFLAAAKVGGIAANNDFPADFIYQNLLIQTNVIHEAYRAGVKKLLFLGSSCIYPKNAPQPLKEEYLLSGYLEPTNEPYAIAKIAGIKMCQSYNRQYGTNFIAVMPTNLYGPQDNFDLKTSHVLPALIRKFLTAVRDNAREVVVWGSGEPRREFLHSDDMARGCLYVMNNFTPTAADNEAGRIFLNLGTGEDVRIADVVQLVADLAGFTGSIVWDSSKPDGTMRKVMDVSRLNALGFKPAITLRDGVAGVMKYAREDPALLATW
jgi:GDP-L-fucose synthase